MAQQSIMGRITQLARANINALLDQAEDPQKMLDQMVRDYTSAISDAEGAVAQTIGNLRMMEDDEREARGAAGQWGTKAQAASAKADEMRKADEARGEGEPRSGDATEADRFDDLARVALRRQIDAENAATTLAAAIADQTTVVDKLKSGLQEMRVKLDDLRRKRDELIARAKNASAQAKVQDAVRSVDILDPTSEVARFEEKIRREEARIRGHEELAASSLDAQFEALGRDIDNADVEARLRTLKQRD